MSVKCRYLSTLQEYYSLFVNRDEDGNTSNDRCRKALQAALDIRKFEIELYWKRTAFFWAFITVVYTALFTIVCKFVDNPYRYFFCVPIISTLAGLGFFFSLAWHLVNKGSKFWQCNWEKHVSLLEKSEMGPLYDVFLNPRTTGSLWKPTGEYDFSVSKINMCASFAISVLSLVGWVFCYICLVKFCSYMSCTCWVHVPSFIVLIFSVIMFEMSKGNNKICGVSSPLNMVYINPDESEEI